MDIEVIEARDLPEAWFLCLHMMRYIGDTSRIRYGKFHIVVYFRSWDLYNGFSANLAALQLMKEEIVREINTKQKVEDGEIIAISKGLHLYDYAWPLAEIRVGKK